MSGSFSLREGAGAPAPARFRALGWQRAARRDPLDLARLAHQEGAAGLSEALHFGGSLGLTALAALPYAEDGPTALPRLCGLATRLPDEQLGPVLEAIEALASQPPEQRERVEPRGSAACSATLRQLAARPSLPPGERDLAASAEQMLLEQTPGTVVGAPAAGDPPPR